MSDKSRTDATGKILGDLHAIGDAAHQVGEQARQAGAQAANNARDVAQDAQARSASLTSEVKERVASMAQTEKNSLAERLKDIAQAVHRSGEQLEGHQDWAASVVERGADELATLAETLRKNDLRSLMDNLQDLVKRQPALFTGATLAAGFALARVGRIAVASAARTDLPHGSEPPP
ncbi:MAG: hypothetical protein M3Y22_08760 [Pseudomonadota bacterium]|nr:hypothetical protein [Pseudomonadota bacterium]